MHKGFVIFALATLALAGCGKNSGKKETVKRENLSPLVEYCQNLNYEDTVTMRSSENMTQIVKLMLVSEQTDISNGLSILFNGIRHDDETVYATDSLMALYLAHPSSPVRNDELYILYLRTMLSVDSLPEGARIRGEENLRTALLNRQGSRANDVRFIERGGETSSIYDMKAKNTLLIFYDPDCTHCTDILKYVSEDEAISASLDNGDLKVVAIYAEGKRDVWENTKWDLPANWTVGFDLSNVLDNDLYDLPAMPTLYLLDSDKTVLLKDPDLELLHNKIISLNLQ